MKRLALCLVTAALACADSGPMAPASLPQVSLACDLEVARAANTCPEAGSVTLEILVVSVTPVP
jgi:hypothetical protein